MDARGGPHVGALHPPCVMSAFDCIHNDVLVEVLAFLDVESVLQVGGTCPSLRKATLLDRVWTPRLATAGLGRSALDANALTELARFSACPRRLCLQALPWRPRCGADPEGRTLRIQSAYSWRPFAVPASLRQPSAARNFIFLEVYETRDGMSKDTNFEPSELVRVSLPTAETHEASSGEGFISGIKKCIAWKFVSLENCLFGNLTDAIQLTVPLDIDFVNATNTIYVEARIFMQLDGTLLPVLDSCCMEGDPVAQVQHFRYQASDFRDTDLQLSTEVKFQYQNEADSAIPTRLSLIELRWRLEDETYEPHVGDLQLHGGMNGLIAHHNSLAMRNACIVKTGEGYEYTFACDYARDRASNLFDFAVRQETARETWKARMDAQQKVESWESEVERRRAKLDKAECELLAARRELGALS